MNTTTKVIIGLSVAAAAGAAIGMLIAPEKGTEVQQKLKAYAKDWIAGILAMLESHGPTSEDSTTDPREITDAPDISHTSKF